MLMHHLSIGIRNILLVQLFLLVMVPEHAFAVRRELQRLWRSIHAPFRQKKEPEKKRSKFWEIDMTKFEP